MAEKNKNYMQKLLTLIADSARSTKDGKVSSTRLSAYFFLASIISFTISFISIMSTNAFILWKSGAPHIIPSEHIVIFGMLLAHHLTLLGINKNAETKVEQAVQDKLKSLNNSNDKTEVNPKDKEIGDEGLSEEDMI